MGQKTLVDAIILQDRGADGLIIPPQGAKGIQTISGSLVQTNPDGTTSAIGGGGGGGTVASVVAGSGITVNSADPAHPIVSAVNPDVTSVKLGVAGSSLVVSGLTGNSDGGYLIDCYLIKGSATNPVGTKVQINGADLNLQSLIQFAQRAGTSAVDPSGLSTGNFLGWATATTSPVAVANLRMLASAAGERRSMLFLGHTWETTLVQEINTYHGNIFWNDTTTEITSIGIIASVAGGLDVGSWLRVTKLHMPHP